MNHLLKIVPILCLAAGSVMADGHATGDAASGEKGIKKCKACHEVVDNDGNEIFKGGKTGPNLYGLSGRVAASVEGFRYGDSIAALGETGFVWSEDEFVAYVADPTAFLKDKLDDGKARSKMSFKFKKEDDAKDIWAYLVSVSE